VEHLDALTEFKSRIRTQVAGVEADPRYERDAEEALAIINQVIDDVDLRVQEAVARHGLARSRQRIDSADAESLIRAVAPHVQARISGEPSLPHGLLEAVSRLAGTVGSAGSLEVTAAANEADGETLIDLHGKRGLAPEEIPSAPPSSFEPSGVSKPVPALLALIYYLLLPSGEISIDSDASPLVRLRVK
jgi:hypothetical protein